MLKIAENEQPYTESKMKIEVLQKHKGQLNLLHLATHSSFDFNDYLQSSILFHNERLTLTQLISDTSLDFHGQRLCYLSSCESGMAHTDSADELQGMVWSLTYAGANAVMASLWPVDDHAAYLMSVRFYHHWIKEGCTLAQAYTQAMRDISSEDYCDEEEQENPYYWAPFVLFGNGWQTWE
jgi:CHAT domain-containing protein